MTDTDLKKYDLMVVISGELTEGDFEKELAEVRKLIKENSKEIVFEESWGRRDMAYAIKRQKRGYYVNFIFNAGPGQVAELGVLKLNPVVLRHLLISVPAHYDAVKYKNMMLREQKQQAEAAAKKPPMRREMRRPLDAMAASAPVRKTPAPVTAVERDELAKVEKKLEKILENPDIDIR